MMLQTWHVLVVEDEPDNLELLCALMRHKGIRCVGVKSAEEALEALQAMLPTLILIDLSLPGKNGWELLNILRTSDDYGEIPRIAITAYHTAELAEQAIQAGFDAYFAKPIVANSFVNDLEAVMNGLHHD